MAPGKRPVRFDPLPQSGPHAAGRRALSRGMRGGGRGEGLPPGLEGREELPPGASRDRTPCRRRWAARREGGQGLETAPGQQREPQIPQTERQEVKQLVVDLRTDEDRQAVTGQARSSVARGELPGEFPNFFHPDPLGSTSYVTDGKGAVYEHMQYFPFGETWVQTPSGGLGAAPPDFFTGFHPAHPLDRRGAAA